MAIVRESEAIHHSREGVAASYYQFPDIMGGMTVASAEFTGPHGERTLGKHPRIYVVTRGTGEFVINGDHILAESGDVVAIPAQATYNLFPKDGPVAILLFMELLDTSTLPK